MNKAPEEKTEVEKLLKEKMDGLASNVDCFDKIAERAFPVKKDDPAEKWISVDGVEKAKSGRSGLRAFGRVAAAAAAVAVVVLAVPKTISHINMKDKLRDEKSGFDSLVSEMLSETENNDYRILDVSLEKYARQDFLVTPFYSCPFSYSGEDAKVRTFIRLAGDVPTNQIYAVEYSGEYSEENFVAVAKSSASFSDAEIAELAASEPEPNPCEGFLTIAPEVYYSAIGSAPNGDRIFPAGFSGIMFFKENDETNRVGYDFVYAKDESSADAGTAALPLVYDYIADCKAAPAYEPTPNGWALSLRRDDSSALPESSDCAPKRTDFFGGSFVSGVSSYKPFANSDSPDSLLSDDSSLDFTLEYYESGRSVSELVTVVAPEDPALWDSFTVFYPNYGGSAKLYVGGSTTPADTEPENSYETVSACYERIEELSVALVKYVSDSQEGKAVIQRKVDIYYSLLEASGKYPT